MKIKFDAVLTYASTREMSDTLAGDRVRRIRQLSPDVYMFTMWGQGERDFIVSLASGSARIHAVTGEYGHADTPSAFCMLLRKHLEGMRLAKVSTPSLERVALLDFESPHVPARRLVVELLPNLRSMVLLDENGKVMGDLRRLRRKGDTWSPLTSATEIAAVRAEAATHAAQAPARTASSRAHSTAPGEAPASTPQAAQGPTPTPRREAPAPASEAAQGPAPTASSRTHPTRRAKAAACDPRASQGPDPSQDPVSPRRSALELSGPDLVALLGAMSADEARNAARAVVRASFGIGLSHARRILATACLDPELSLEALVADTTGLQRLAMAWDGFWRPLADGRLEAVRGDHPSVGAMLEEAFASGSDEATLHEERDKLATGVSRHRDRVRRRIEAQESDLQGAREAEKWRHHADLLMANLYRVKPRAASIQVEDYEQPDCPTIEITLDPDLSATDNAQKLYARYKKSRRGEEAIQEALGRSRLELDYWENLLASITTARDRDELREIALDLAASKRSRPDATGKKKKPKKRPRTPASRPRRFTAGDWEILVGRNPRQNELLTMKQAGSQDWWLHARQIPGAHVILRRTGGAPGDPPSATVEAAARLAACFSGAASDTRVPIDYTRVRYVKKPPGTPPGYVIYSHEKTVTVEPDLEAALKVVHTT